ncbi:MAG: DUF4336 domain-containing protein, partial [Thiomonas sp.]
MIANAYEPYSPLDMLKPVADGVWMLDGPEIRMDYLGTKLPFPTRMTVVRLPDGGLWVHSPTEPTDAVFAAVAALGPVRHLVAPNTLHYWWIPQWHARYPEARVHAVAVLRRRAKRPLPAFTALGDAPDPAWAGVMDQVLVPGSLLTEVDFFHRPTRTLILTDLIENFEPARVRSPRLRWLMRIFGAADPDGKAPFDMQLSFLGHRGAVRRAAQRMLDWAPE